MITKRREILMLVSSYFRNCPNILFVLTKKLKNFSCYRNPMYISDSRKILCEIEKMKKETIFFAIFCSQFFLIFSLSWRTCFYLHRMLSLMLKLNLLDPKFHELSLLLIYVIAKIEKL